MCSKPKAPKVSVRNPEVLRNPFLDESRGDGAAVAALRSGNAAFRIPLDTGLGIGFTGRDGSGAGSATGSPAGNAGPRDGAGGGSGIIGAAPSPGLRAAGTTGLGNTVRNISNALIRKQFYSN